MFVKTIKKNKTTFLLDLTYPILQFTLFFKQNATILTMLYFNRWKISFSTDLINFKKYPSKNSALLLYDTNIQDFIKLFYFIRYFFENFFIGYSLNFKKK
jgi:hypothetical protein